VIILQPFQLSICVVAFVWAYGD